MNMSNEDLAKLLSLRKDLVLEYEKYTSFRSDKNAIMKEWDHIKVLGATIKKIDDFLSKFVQFS